MAPAALLVLLTALGVANDPGDRASYALTYQAAPGCPDETQLRADLDAHIHDRARARGARVEIILQRSGRETAGEMTLDDRAGNRQRRSLHGPDCADVAHALAFLAGLAIDLAPAEAAPPASPPRVVVSAPVVVVPPPPPSPPAGHRFAAAIRAAGELRGGLADAPRPVGVIGLTVEDLRPRRFAPTAGIAVVGGGGGMTGPRGSADLWLLGGRLSFCPLRLLPAGVELRPCAAGEVGSVWARATTLVNPPSVRRPWLSAEATLSVRWPRRGRVFADLEAGVIVPLIRSAYTFAFDPGQPLYAVPAVTARAAAGGGYRF